MKTTIKVLFWILLFIIAVKMLPSICSSFENNNHNIEETPVGSMPVHNYDWEMLYENNGKKHYDDGHIKALAGIDVSVHQGDIDWKQVKNGNIDFAIIRAGYRGYESGEITEDDKFQYNIASAHRAGIDVGVYFFSQATSIAEAEQEAKFVIDLIKDYEVKYPIVFDMEYIKDGRIRDLSVKERTETALAFCEEIEKAGYKAMIYGNASWLQNSVLLADMAQYDLWLSEYTDIPTFPYDFKMWQYTDQGIIPGISGDVDLNLYFEKQPL